MPDAEIRTTPSELCFFELCAIVCQDSFGHAKSIYDALQELNRCLLGYVHQWNGFHPLGECVDPNE
jgi:hypothetical protein